jgi:hypothetical protein
MCSVRKIEKKNAPMDFLMYEYALSCYLLVITRTFERIFKKFNISISEIFECILNLFETAL